MPPQASLLVPIPIDALVGRGSRPYPMCIKPGGATVSGPQATAGIRSAKGVALEPRDATGWALPEFCWKIPFWIDLGVDPDLPLIFSRPCVNQITHSRMSLHPIAPLHGSAQNGEAQFYLVFGNTKVKRPHPAPIGFSDLECVSRKLHHLLGRHIQIHGERYRRCHLRRCTALRCCLIRMCGELGM
jgi:hypothetical protein